jgi:hypothetical protein
LTNGEDVPEASIAAKANRKNRHHIFPRALLMRHGVRQTEINSICNICFVVAEENQSIGSKKPMRYLEPYQRKRHFRRVMQSHLIPYSSPALWTPNTKSGFKQFLQERRALLCRVFNQEAGMRLFAN